ncbi:Uncharacterized protein ChrSV_0431 [Chromobacterium vaccinii]|nr:Uncharacterized protein ChrSW_0431 [Chromobacterium vaccinii]QND87890.1 Uncharacterized protein ChrSV_0431 [Chromobacterium vaccinii]
MLLYDLAILVWLPIRHCHAMRIMQQGLHVIAIEFSWQFLKELLVKTA